jgi:hypothetical protein
MEKNEGSVAVAWKRWPIPWKKHPEALKGKRFAGSNYNLV